MPILIQFSSLIWWIQSCSKDRSSFKACCNAHLSYLLKRCILFSSVPSARLATSLRRKDQWPEGKFYGLMKQLEYKVLNERNENEKHTVVSSLIHEFLSLALQKAHVFCSSWPDPVGRSFIQCNRAGSGIWEGNWEYKK